MSPEYCPRTKLAKYAQLMGAVHNQDSKTVTKALNDTAFVNDLHPDSAAELVKTSINSIKTKSTTLLLSNDNFASKLWSGGKAFIVNAAIKEKATKTLNYLLKKPNFLNDLQEFHKVGILIKAAESQPHYLIRLISHPVFKDDAIYESIHNNYRIKPGTRHKILSAHAKVIGLNLRLSLGLNLNVYDDIVSEVIGSFLTHPAYHNTLVTSYDNLSKRLTSIKQSAPISSRTRSKAKP